MSKKNFEKKKIKKKNFFCENEKLNYPRFLGDFYYHGTMNVPCISELLSIRNWVTFCGFDLHRVSLSPWMTICQKTRLDYKPSTRQKEMSNSDIFFLGGWEGQDYLMFQFLFKIRNSKIVFSLWYNVRSYSDRKKWAKLKSIEKYMCCPMEAHCRKMSQFDFICIQFCQKKLNQIFWINFKGKYNFL